MNSIAVDTRKPVVPGDCKQVSMRSGEEAGERTMLPLSASMPTMKATMAPTASDRTSSHRSSAYSYSCIWHSSDQTRADEKATVDAHLVVLIGVGFGGFQE